MPTARGQAWATSLAAPEASRRSSRAVLAHLVPSAGDPMRSKFGVVLLGVVVVMCILSFLPW